jgi:hypothetical protein
MEPECEADDAPVFFSFESDQSNGFLSPAFLSSFEYIHVKYNCNEQFFQAMKAGFFISDNYDLFIAIRSATDPREQKALGKHIKVNDATMRLYWRRAGELSRYGIRCKRLINSGSGISSYRDYNAPEVYGFRTRTYAFTEAHRYETSRACHGRSR